MSRRFPLAISGILALWLSTTSCVYRHTTEPFDINFDNTQVMTHTEDSSIKRFRYSLVDVQWDTNAVSDIARKNGIKTVHYADIETLRVLGVWTQYWVHIYGE